ncbi:MAG: hypothetical protein QOG65_1782 [Actinomycetota bacterium]|nr:hypothetical protein [Actinomycetota bacterium]
MTGVAPGDVDGWIRYHSEISYALTTERTALESALIPVSAYILVACVEAYRRYPEIIEQIDAALPAEDLGRAGHELTTQIDPVHMWAVPNFPLVGRKVLMAAGLVDAADDARRLGTIFDFWARASGAYRFEDGTHQAADANGHATPYRAYVDQIAPACEPISDPEQRAAISRLNALLTSYLFLLWFDTRSGYQDTGPYLLPDGRVLLLRAYNRLGVSHFPWSAEVSADMPHTELLGAFVLHGTQLRVTDFGTSLTQPDDYWPRVEAFAFFDVSSGSLVRLDGTQRDALAVAAKSAQKQLYRKIAGMERREKIDAGAYVYFTFLRPYAELAGVDADWTVPRDSMDLYPFLELIDGSLAPPPDAPVESPETYYLPLLTPPAASVS